MTLRGAGGIQQNSVKVIGRILAEGGTILSADGHPPSYPSCHVLVCHPNQPGKPLAEGGHLFKIGGKLLLLLGGQIDHGKHCGVFHRLYSILSWVR